MKMAIAFKHLTKRADGRTHIVGHRLTPYDILTEYELGEEPEVLAEEYKLSLAEVYEALAYAFDHPDEMAGIREDNRAAEMKGIERLAEHLREFAREQMDKDEQAYQEAAKKAKERRHGAAVP